MAYSEAVEFFHLKTHPIPKLNNSIEFHWISYPRHFYKLNTDGFSFGNPGRGGIGSVIRNSNGDWILGFSQSFLHATNNFMELVALRKGLELVLEQNLHPIVINIDSEIVIHML